MRKFAYLVTGALLAASFSTSAFAQAAPKDDDGNLLAKGWHFNLNIIGVPRGKEASMTGSERHTIFVPLDTSGHVDGKININYVRSDDDRFHVIDGNATIDGEATIAVPYELCDFNSTNSCSDLIAYDVFAVGLGTPGGGAHVDAECVFSDAFDTDGFLILDKDGILVGSCTDTLLMGSFDISRTNGGKNKPKSVDITNVFRASGCIDGFGDPNVPNLLCSAGDLRFRRVWVFNIDVFDSYWWEYDNDNLKLMQVRFYPSDDSGLIEIVQ